MGEALLSVTMKWILTVILYYNIKGTAMEMSACTFLCYPWMLFSVFLNLYPNKSNPSITICQPAIVITLCVVGCAFTTCLTKICCKLLCTQKKKEPQVFFIYTVSW